MSDATTLRDLAEALEVTNPGATADEYCDALCESASDLGMSIGADDLLDEATSEEVFASFRKDFLGEE